MLKENNLGKGLERKKAGQAQAGGQAEYLPKASPGGEVRALMVCDLSSRGGAWSPGLTPTRARDADSASLSQADLDT